ncbi:MAG: CbiX/SirB N-terminal domain-containing protein, partial [Gordonia sp. (in: high G+C Gram-positive bacteria)]|uniref:sirohydrochlorin chelatase n=1 Tax=Gordonia sp. (in: high G+C Gram-positive bacteria) TaxID=84139 RepID=UPI003BB78984
MTLVLAAHGSRDPRFAATAQRVAAAAQRGLPDARVELAYLDRNEPLLADVLDRLGGSGAADVAVVPLLFGDGFHSKSDLPEMLRRARLRHPGLRVRQTPVVGRYSPVPALIDRITEAAAPLPELIEGSKDTGVLLYAVGSSDPGSDASVRERGRELSGVLGVPVQTVFATRLGTGGGVVREAVSRLTAQGATRVAAVPLFLSAGLL